VASFDRKWLHAQVNLAWRLVVHLAKKLWPWAPRFGFARFQQNYVGEGLPPSTAAFRTLAHEPGRCTSCGQCDVICPILRGTLDAGADAHAFLGPMAFVLSGTRAAPHLDDVAATLRVLNGPACGGCRACDATCPERIPIAALAAAHEGLRGLVEVARSGALPLTDAKRALPPWVGRGAP
jgi:formate hydrogenlyase subunit 6/NADH:ubiquinone oxidoreductase subunit I